MHLNDQRFSGSGASHCRSPRDRVHVLSYPAKSPPSLENLAVPNNSYIMEPTAKKEQTALESNRKTYKIPVPKQLYQKPHHLSPLQPMSSASLRRVCPRSRPLFDGLSMSTVSAATGGPGPEEYRSKQMTWQGVGRFFFLCVTHV